MQLKIGNRVKVYHETQKHVCYGLGTIEDIGYYIGGTRAYFVRLDAFPNTLGDYNSSQLKVVRGELA